MLLLFLSQNNKQQISKSIRYFQNLSHKNDIPNFFVSNFSAPNFSLPIAFHVFWSPKWLLYYITIQPLSLTHSTQSTSFLSTTPMHENVHHPKRRTKISQTVCRFTFFLWCAATKLFRQKRRKRLMTLSYRTWLIRDEWVEGTKWMNERVRWHDMSSMWREGNYLSF
jgi:hypothetical protein